MKQYKDNIKTVSRSEIGRDIDSQYKPMLYSGKNSVKRGRYFFMLLHSYAFENAKKTVRDMYDCDCKKKKKNLLLTLLHACSEIKEFQLTLMEN